jgi:D-Tyr-tRNAtyr deacylase
VAEPLFNYFKIELGKRISSVESGVFGSDMRTDMETDGPVTIVMDSIVLKK